MIRVAIAGAAGRMGRNLVHACALSEHTRLTQATDKPGNSLIGTDAGVVAGIEPQNVMISEVLEADEFDVLVDFTHPSVTTNHVDYCRKNNKKECFRFNCRNQENSDSSYQTRRNNI